MQIASIPPPIMTTPLAQDVAAKTVPHVHAAPPLVQHAVDPTPKGEKFNETRHHHDRRDHPNPDEPQNHAPDAQTTEDNPDSADGHLINISV